MGFEQLNQKVIDQLSLQLLVEYEFFVYIKGRGSLTERDYRRLIWLKHGWLSPTAPEREF